MSRWVANPELAQFHISIGDLSLSSTGREWETANSYVIGVQKLTGWRHGLRDTTESITHESGLGSYAGDLALDARTIEIEGVILAKSMADLLAAEDRLDAFSRTVLTVRERVRGISREADVRSLGVTPGARVGLFQSFRLTMLADDPLLYSSGVQVLSTGVNVLMNRGDRAAFPVLEVAGQRNALTIAHPGGTWNLTATPANQYRVVDLRNGDIWVDNNRIFGAETGPAPVVPAGGGEWTVTGGGSGAVRLRRFEAWS